MRSLCRVLLAVMPESCEKYSNNLSRTVLKMMVWFCWLFIPPVALLSAMYIFSPTICGHTSDAFYITCCLVSSASVCCLVARCALKEAEGLKEAPRFEVDCKKVS